ncbi:MAG: arginine--tRNA ligase [Candidatus Omnitrophota bacterium]
MFEKVENQISSLLRESVERFLKDSFQASSGQGASHPDASKLEDVIGELILDIPKEKSFGDISCNIAMRLSGLLRMNPHRIAEGIIAKFQALDGTDGRQKLADKLEVKGAGFINLFLFRDVFYDVLKAVNEQKDVYGASDAGCKKRLLLEFVSANPTGPLSVAHARQAAVGDALSNILAMAGFDVTKEFYLNDEGNQINILGRSIHLRFNELCGEHIEFPEDHYQGQYIIDLAKVLVDDEQMRLKIEAFSVEEKASFFIDYGVEKILAMIRSELDDFGVHFDVWYSQKELGISGKVERTLDHLKDKGLIYESEGAVWFKSTQFGDDKDRVVRKSDGSYTYLMPDIAYHEDKFARGYEKLINIWGPDHHGYIPRMKAAVEALGQDRGALSVIIVQLATLFRQGQPAPMSTRKGQYVTLREVLEEVGSDASRFFFLMRKTDSHLDFDLELAKKHTSENPVYYVQYAHARIAGILKGAPKDTPGEEELNLALLKEAEELDLIKTIFEYGYCLKVCLKQLDPYGLTVYLQSLASVFHKFYDKHKVLSDDMALTRARLFLIQAVRIILANGLHIIGVSSPERM